MKTFKIIKKTKEKALSCKIREIKTKNKKKYLYVHKKYKKMKTKKKQ